MRRQKKLSLIPTRLLGLNDMYNVPMHRGGKPPSHLTSDLKPRPQIVLTPEGHESLCRVPLALWP